MATWVCLHCSPICVRRLLELFTLMQLSAGTSPCETRGAHVGGARAASRAVPSGDDGCSPCVGCSADRPCLAPCSFPWHDFCVGRSLWDRENPVSGKSEGKCALADRVARPSRGAVTRRERGVWGQRAGALHCACIKPVHVFENIPRTRDTLTDIYSGMKMCCCVFFVVVFRFLFFFLIIIVSFFSMGEL